MDENNALPCLPDQLRVCHNGHPFSLLLWQYNRHLPPCTDTPNPRRYHQFRQTKEHSHQCICPPRHYADQDRDRPAVPCLNGKSDPTSARTMPRSCESACPTPAIHIPRHRRQAHTRFSPEQTVPPRRTSTSKQKKAFGEEECCLHKQFDFPIFNVSFCARMSKATRVHTHRPCMHRHPRHSPRFAPLSALAPSGFAPVPRV